MIIVFSNALFTNACASSSVVLYVITSSSSSFLRKPPIISDSNVELANSINENCGALIDNNSVGILPAKLSGTFALNTITGKCTIVV